MPESEGQACWGWERDGEGGERGSEEMPGEGPGLGGLLGRRAEWVGQAYLRGRIDRAW